MSRLICLVCISTVFLLGTAAAGDAGKTPEAFRECTGCHTRTAVGAVMHPVSCSTCHTEVHAADAAAPEGLDKPVPELCLSCHQEEPLLGTGADGMGSVHPPVAGGMCTSCHSPHASANKRLLLMAPEDLCSGCHEPFAGLTAHPPAAMGACLDCHNPHASASPSLLKDSLPSLCLSCHEVSLFAGTQVHAPVIEGMCPTCHNPHASDNNALLTFPAEELCFNCHTLKDLKRRNIHEPAKDGMCTTCHSPHASSNIFQLLSPINELCLTCHPTVADTPHMVGGFSREGHVLSGKPDPRRKGRELSCTSCHNPHGSNNRVMLRFRQRSTMKICGNCHK